MELMFNEQSVVPYADSKEKAYTAVKQFLQTYKEAQKHGFNRIRFEKSFDEIMLSNNFTLNDYCFQPNTRIFRDLLIGLARYPYIDNNSSEEQRFIDNNFYIKRDSDLIPVEGLGVAYLYQSVGISFSFDLFWHQVKYKLYVTGKEEGEYDVISISHPDHCSDADFLIQKELNQPICLIESADAPSGKIIHLREDHGKDILKAFTTRLCNSPYVKGIINSLPYNSAETHFIRAIRDDGLIEIVLTKTDKGLGLVVQSTGRNKRETEAIAVILERDFA